MCVNANFSLFLSRARLTKRCLAGLEKPDQGAVGVEGRPAVIYVEQEQQVPEGKVAWRVADALTEPMVAGLSADTPAAKRVAGALKVSRMAECVSHGGV